MSEFPLQIPKVADLKVRDSQVILVAHPSLKLTLHHDLNPESAVEFRLSVLEILLGMLESGELRAAEIPEGLSVLVAALLIPADTTPANNGQPIEPASSLQENRLAELQQELRELLPAGQFDLRADDLISAGASRDLTKWQSLLPGVLPHSERPDRRTIFFSIPESPEQSKIWWMSRTWYRAGIAIVVAMFLIPLSLMVIRSRSMIWILHRRSVMWLLIGLIWWTCLQLSAVGLVIAAASAIALGWTCLAPGKSHS